jgi:hypothetical protein
LSSHPAPWAKVRPEIMVANNSHHLAVFSLIPLAGNKMCCYGFIIFLQYFSCITLIYFILMTTQSTDHGVEVFGGQSLEI